MCDHIILCGRALQAFHLEESKEVSDELVKTYQNKMLRMVTTLLLSYEQAYRNNYSYNKLAPDRMSKKSKDNSCVAFTTVVAREIIKLGLHETNCLEQMITTLQIILLLCEQKEIIDKPDLIPLFTTVTECLIKVAPNDNNLMKLFEVLSICTMIKILDMVPLTKSKDPLLDNIIADKGFLAKICLMRKFKPHARIYTGIFISRLGQYPAYYKSLVTEIKDKVSFCVKREDRRCEAR